MLLEEFDLTTQQGRAVYADALEEVGKPNGWRNVLPTVIASGYGYGYGYGYGDGDGDGYGYGYG